MGGGGGVKGPDPPPPPLVRSLPTGLRCLSTSVGYLPRANKSKGNKAEKCNPCTKKTSTCVIFFSTKVVQFFFAVNRKL